MAANKNTPVYASKKATGRVGGTNASVKTEKNPTKYTGGKNSGSIPKKGQGR
jgi:hypothetical protein